MKNHTYASRASSTLSRALAQKIWKTKSIAFALLILSGLLFASCSRQTTNRSSPYESNSPAPQNSLMPQSSPAAVTSFEPTESFTLQDSRHMSLAGYRGKVVVLDFYATWCGPCVQSIPHLVDLQRRYGSNGLKIIGLNVGGPDDPAKVPDFARGFHITYELGIPDAAMTEKYLFDNDAIPQTFVIDRQGKAVNRFIGFDDSMPVALERTIQNALQEKSE
ncbi:MAG: redoxin family protein [Pyrinomonadaceae bacterium]